ncbi:MAG: hypothetical protein ACXWQ5_18310 [Ktedonobacterales bacterium]
MPTKTNSQVKRHTNSSVTVITRTINQQPGVKDVAADTIDDVMRRAFPPQPAVHRGGTQA